MRISISGHHTDTGNALRYYVEEQFNLKIKKYFKDIIETKVFFGKVGKGQDMFSAEILVKDGQGKHAEFRANAEHSDIKMAFDRTLNKLEQQVRKYHDKITHSFKRKMKYSKNELELSSDPNT